MYDFDVAAVILGHREGMLATASIRSLYEAVDYARAHGLKVQCVAILDNADNETIDVFQAEGRDWLSINIVNYGDPGLSRNYAAKIVKSKYICNIDSDDLWSFNWIYKAWRAVEEEGSNVICHPRLNFYFNSDDHVFRHVSTTEPEFDVTALAFQNYWTSLCFCATEVIQRIPYPKSEVTSGIGYEDWWWNMETLSQGIQHLAIDDTAHFIRRRLGSVSQVSIANMNVPPKSKFLVSYGLIHEKVSV